MRVLLLLAGLLILSSSLKAQALKDTCSKQDIIYIIEDQPVPPGGIEGLYGFIAKNLTYPDVARKKKIQGRVVVEFVVQEDGSIDKNSVRAMESVHTSLDEEAIRVIRLCPNWTPGMQDGKPVRVTMAVPIAFKMKR